MEQRYIISAGLVLTIGLCNAQFTQIGTANTYLYTVHSLPTAGMKLVTYDGAVNNVQLLNPDLSVFVDFTLPVAAEGARGFPMYITEDLFDTDPTTIEFMCSESGSVVVYRQDGSVVFSTTGYLMDAPGYWDQKYQRAIASTPDGPVLAVGGLFSGGTSKLFLLPGELPCPECNGSIIPENTTGTVDQFQITPSPVLEAYPNPADNLATIHFDLPEGTRHADLVFFNEQGAELKRIPVYRSGIKTITTADLAAGTYLYHVETDQGMIGAKRLVVVK